MKTLNTSLNIDGIDKKILRTLMQDARTPILEIARNVGISGAAIHQRLKKLEKAKLISKYALIVNPKVLGFETVSYIGVYLDKAMTNVEAIKFLKKIPQVIECHCTTGHWNIFIKVICKDNTHLMYILNEKIQSISGVSRTETFISLEQQIDRQITI
jgi:Lrp/AsnC family transcriptional regulator for asnA, asnC and gidA